MGGHREVSFTPGKAALGAQEAPGEKRKARREEDTPPPASNAHRMTEWSPVDDTFDLRSPPFFFFPSPPLSLSSSPSFARAFSTRFRCFRSASSFSSYCVKCGVHC